MAGQNRSCQQESSPVAAFLNGARHVISRQVARGGVSASKKQNSAQSRQKKKSDILAWMAACEMSELSKLRASAFFC